MAPKLGEILIGAKIIDQHQLESALSAQQKWGGKLGEILVNKGLCSEEMLVKSLSRQLDIARADLDLLSSVAPEVLAKIPLELSIQLDAVPIELRQEGPTLVVAMSDPLNAQSLETLQKQAGTPIHPLLAGPQAIARCRAKLYGTELPPSADRDATKNARGHDMVLAGGDFGSRQTVALGRKTSLSGTSSSPSVPPTASQEPEKTSQTSHVVPLDVSGPEILRALVDTLVDKGIFSSEDFLRHLNQK